MRLPQAFRSLARPSSALEPSHSPAGTVASCYYTSTNSFAEFSGRLDRTYTRSSSNHPGCERACSSNPSYPRFPGVVHRSLLHSRLRPTPLKGTVSSRAWYMDPLGFEPRASSLQGRHSPTELRARPPCGGRGVCLCELDGPSVSGLAARRARDLQYAAMSGELARVGESRSVGGDPAADSPTATLLRLKPPCEAQIRLPLGSLIRTSLGCFDGRCVQGAGTYSPRAADTRLLPNPASCGRVAAHNPNYDQVCEITVSFRSWNPLS